MGSKMSAGKPEVAAATVDRIPTAEVAAQFAEEAIPLDRKFSYFFFGYSPTDSERKEYLEEPLAAVPPAVTALLPKIYLYFVPFLERPAGKRGGPAMVCLKRPAKSISAARTPIPSGEALLLAFEQRDLGECHYRLYQGLATLTAERWPQEVEQEYTALVRQELRGNVHGEVDELSWEAKIALLEKQSRFHASNKGLRDYVRQSFIDTMTLYLHGICCDLDVETGPRQLATRHLRKRLELLERAFPPPKGFAVFPEELPKN